MESSSAAVLLSDGRLVWVRPLRLEDAHRLIDLCQRLSPETRRRPGLPQHVYRRLSAFARCPQAGRRVTSSAFPSRSGPRLDRTAQPDRNE
jgi:hypothetical protein